MTLVLLLKQLAMAAAQAAVDRVAELVSGQRKEPEHPDQEPPHVTWKQVEHIRAQERSSIEASKKAGK